MKSPRLRFAPTIADSYECYLKPIIAALCNSVPKGAVIVPLELPVGEFVFKAKIDDCRLVAYYDPGWHLETEEGFYIRGDIAYRIPQVTRPLIPEPAPPPNDRPGST